MNIDVFHGKSSPEKRHRDRRRVGKTVRQQVQELLELAAIDRAQPGGQIENRLSGHPARQAVVQRIRHEAADAGLGRGRAGADDHVIALPEDLQQTPYVGGAVLAVAVHEDQGVVRGGAGAGLDAGAIALAVLVRHRSDAAGGADGRRVVGGAIVDHDDLRGRKQRPQFRQEAAQVHRLVTGRQDDRDGVGCALAVTHGEARQEFYVLC